MNSHYSEHRWTAPRLQTVARAYGATHLILYPRPHAAMRLARESGLICDLMVGRSPGWLQREADNGEVVVFRVAIPNGR